MAARNGHIKMILFLLALVHYDVNSVIYPAAVVISLPACNLIGHALVGHDIIQIVIFCINCLVVVGGIDDNGVLGGTAVPALIEVVPFTCAIKKAGRNAWHRHQLKRQHRLESRYSFTFL